MNALGRMFNLLTSATTANTRVNLKNATGVTIVATGATSGAVTIQEHNAASSGTSQNLAVIVNYWTQNNGVWTKVTQAAGATFTCATGGLAVAEIDTAKLSDGFNYISASHASASMLLVLHDLEVQRNPTFLADIRA
jgi:thiamine phosphate synthase YjbQ (UPF0047 family)